MTKYDLVRKVVKRTKIPIRICNDVINCAMDEIFNALANEERVNLPGIITIEVLEYKARRGRNPITGVVQDYPPTKRVNCKVSKKLKRAIKEREELDD